MTSVPCRYCTSEHTRSSSARGSSSVFGPGRQVEQSPVLGLGQEGIEDLFEVPCGDRILVGAVEHTGPSKNLPPRVALPFLGQFNGPSPRDPVGDLLLLLFELGDPLIR